MRCIISYLGDIKVITMKDKMTSQLVPNNELDAQKIAQIRMAMERMNTEVVSSLPAS